jgi:ribosomal protein S19E (S16A)
LASYYVDDKNNVAFAKTRGTKEKLPKEMWMWFLCFRSIGRFVSASSNFVDN